MDEEAAVPHPSEPSLGGWQLYALLLFVQVADGAYGALTRTTFFHTGDVLVFSLVAHVFAFVVIQTITICLDGWRVPPRDSIGRVVFVGTAWYLTAEVCSIVLDRVDVALSFTVAHFMPAVAWSGMVLIGAEKAALRRMIAAAVVAVAGAVIVGPMFGSVAHSVASGVYCASFPLFLLAQESLLEEYPTLVVVTWCQMVAALEAGLVSLYNFPWDWDDSLLVWQLPVGAAAPLCATIVGLCAKLVALTFANTRGPVVTLSLWSGVACVVDVGLSVLFLGDPLSLRYVGAPALLCAVAIGSGDPGPPSTCSAWQQQCMRVVRGPTLEGRQRLLEEAPNVTRLRTPTIGNFTLSADVPRDVTSAKDRIRQHRVTSESGTIERDSSHGSLSSLSRGSLSRGSSLPRGRMTLEHADSDLEQLLGGDGTFQPVVLANNGAKKKDGGLFQWGAGAAE